MSLIQYHLYVKYIVMDFIPGPLLINKPLSHPLICHIRQIAERGVQLRVMARITHQTGEILPAWTHYVLVLGTLASHRLAQIWRLEKSVMQRDAIRVARMTASIS